MIENIKKTVELESVHCVMERGELRAILRRDPVSKKNLVYIVKEASCNEIADLMLDTPIVTTKQL